MHLNPAPLRLPNPFVRRQREAGGSAKGAAKGRSHFWLALLAWACSSLCGCATYVDHLAQATRYASIGNYTDAVGAMNEILGVDSSEQLPDSWSGDRPLAVLERGTLQQALTSFQSSSRDLSAAEEKLELLDLTSDPVGVLGSYLYSDSVKAYKTPPTERLAVNAVNLLNYLGQGDLDGAAVEARRFQVMRDYLASHFIEADGPATLGAYLSGFVFEKSGEGDRALRYYEEALSGGPLPTLEDPVRRLAATHPYRGPRLSALLGNRKPAARAAPAPAEVLVVLSLGRVPHREPQRIPIGAAVALAGVYATQNADWLRYGAGKLIAYPELVSTPSSLDTPTLRVDGATVALDELTDFGASIRKEYDKAKPMIIAAALSRMAARAAMAEGVRAAGKQADKGLGDILSFLFESTMAAFDRPDTRSWTTLPQRVLVARIAVPAGQHNIEVDFGAQPGRQATVEVTANGYAAVVVTEPR